MRFTFLFCVILCCVSAFSQVKKTYVPHGFSEMDSVWAETHFFKTRAQLVSIEKTSLLPCGMVSDWTLGVFKIIETDNPIVATGKSYTFYMRCGCGLNDVKAKPGENFTLYGLISFQENSDWSAMNGFRKDHPDRLYLAKIVE